MPEWLLLVHFFYENACCHEMHCHPVACSEVSDTAEGWKWRGKLFTRSMLRHSPDGACHVCIAAAPLCIYLPPET